MTFTDLDYVEQQARKGATTLPPSIMLALVQRIRETDARNAILSQLVDSLQTRDTEPPRPVLENPGDLFKPGAPLRLTFPEADTCNCDQALTLQARVLELESFRARTEALLRQLGLLHNLDVGGPYGPSTPASRRI